LSNSEAGSRVLRLLEHKVRAKDLVTCDRFPASAYEQSIPAFAFLCYNLNYYKFIFRVFPHQTCVSLWSKTMKKVSIYTTPSCLYCNQAKEFFKENNVEYEAFDVSTDEEKRKEMIEKSGQMGVPVIFVDDEMIVGFDKAKLTELLSL